MLVIRFFRVGKKNQPSFKIVVTDKRKSSVKGTYVEEVGFLDPLKKKRFLRADRIKYWLSVGAKPSATVHNLLISEKIIEGKKINKFKKPKKKEEKKAEAPVTVAATAPAEPVAEETKKEKEEKAPEEAKTPEAKTEEAKTEEPKPPEPPEEKPETK